MPGDDDRNSVVGLVFAAHDRKRFGRSEQVLGRCSAKANQHFWLYKLDLLLKIGQAGGDFVGFGSAIAWRPAFVEVGDEDL